MVPEPHMAHHIHWMNTSVWICSVGFDMQRLYLFFFLNDSVPRWQPIPKWLMKSTRFPYLFSLVFPVSMTNTTSGIVTPVSAMLVDNTILKEKKRKSVTFGGPIFQTLKTKVQYLPDTSRGHCESRGLLLRWQRRVQSNDPKSLNSTFKRSVNFGLNCYLTCIGVLTSPVFILKALVWGQQVKELLDVSQPGQKDQNGTIQCCELRSFI